MSYTFSKETKKINQKNCKELGKRMGLKGMLGSALAGAARRTSDPLINPPTIRKEYRSGGDKNSQTIIHEKRESSIIGGFVRGALTDLFVRGAYWGLEGDISKITRRGGDGLANYIDRIRGRRNP